MARRSSIFDSPKGSTSPGQYALPSAAPMTVAEARMAPNGEMPKAIIMHHTSNRGRGEAQVNAWKQDPRAIGSQYIVERDGTVRDTLKDLGWKGTNHIITGSGKHGEGLNNSNVVGYEVVANDDKDVTPEQIKAIREHVEANYPKVPLRGHEQVNPGHREKTEGMTAVNAINNERSSLRGEVNAAVKPAGAEAKVPKQYALPGGGKEPGVDTAARMTAEAKLPSQMPATATAEAKIAPPGSYKYPASVAPETIAAINKLAAERGIHPDAIAGVIDTESVWNPAAATGSYRGLTQMGPKTFQEAGGRIGGMTFDEYSRATPAQQVAAYGAWLDHYGFADKTKAAGVDFSKMSPAQQAAYLQGFQFGPNAVGWQSQYGKGDDTMRATLSRQKPELGDTSMKAMTAYYEKMFGGPGGKPKETEVADAGAVTAGAKAPGAEVAPARKAPDIGKAFDVAAKGLDPTAQANQFALPGAKQQAIASGADQIAKAFTPDDKAPKAETPLAAAGGALGAVADAKMMKDARGPFKGLPSPLVNSLAPEPSTAPTFKPAPEATPEAPKAPAGKVDLAGDLSPPGFRQPEPPKGVDLSPPGPLVPKITTPPVNEAANAKLAEAFPGPDRAPPLPTQNFANLFGETPNATGTGSPPIIAPPPAPPPQVAFNSSTDLSPPGSQMGSVPGTDVFAQGFGKLPDLSPKDTTVANLFGETPNATGSAGRDELAKAVASANEAPKLEESPSAFPKDAPTQVAEADLGGGGGRSGFGGVIVPPVHTPLNFSGGVIGDTQSEFGGYRDPWLNVNPGGGGGGAGGGGAGGDIFSPGFVSAATAAAAGGGGSPSMPEQQKAPEPEIAPTVTPVVKAPGPEQYAAFTGGPGPQPNSTMPGNQQRQMLAWLLNSGRLV